MQFPDALKPNINKSYFYFLADSPSWLALIDERLQSWCGSATVEFTYDEDFLVNDAMIDKLFDKMKVPAKARMQALDSTSTATGNRYNLFRSVVDLVEVEFFSRLDYQTGDAHRTCMFLLVSLHHNYCRGNP